MINKWRAPVELLYWRRKEKHHVFMGENAKQTKFLITTATMGANLDIHLGCY